MKGTVAVCVAVALAGCGAERVVGVQYMAEAVRPGLSAGVEWEYGQGLGAVAFDEAELDLSAAMTPAGTEVTVRGLSRRAGLRAGVVLERGKAGLALSAGLSLYDLAAQGLTAEDHAALAGNGATLVSRTLDDSFPGGVVLRLEGRYDITPAVRLTVFGEAHRCLAEARYRFWYDDPADPSDIPGWRTETGWLDIEPVTAGISVALIF